MLLSIYCTKLLHGNRALCYLRFFVKNAGVGAISSGGVGQGIQQEPDCLRSIPVLRHHINSWFALVNVGFMPLLLEWSLAKGTGFFDVEWVLASVVII